MAALDAPEGDPLRFGLFGVGAESRAITSGHEATWAGQWRPICLFSLADALARAGRLSLAPRRRAPCPGLFLGSVLSMAEFGEFSGRKGSDGGQVLAAKLAGHGRGIDGDFHG